MRRRCADAGPFGHCAPYAPGPHKPTCPAYSGRARLAGLAWAWAVLSVACGCVAVLLGARMVGTVAIGLGTGSLVTLALKR